MRLSYLLIFIFFSCAKSGEYLRLQEFLDENLTIQSTLNQEKFNSYQALIESNTYDRGAIPEIKSIMNLKELLTNGSVDSNKFLVLINKLDSIKLDGKMHKVGDEYILTQLKNYKVSDLSALEIKNQVLSLISIQINLIIDYCINYSYKERVCFDRYAPVIFPKSVENNGDSIEVYIGFMAFDKENLDLFIDGEQVSLSSPTKIKHDTKQIHSISVETRNDNGVVHTFETKQILN